MGGEKGNRIVAEPPRREDVEPPMKRSTSIDAVEKYLTDESALLRGEAEEVVLPETENHISSLLREANARKIPVTVSGAGTGITGSRVPQGGVILSTERLTRVFKGGLPSPTLFTDPVTGVEYELCIMKSGHCAVLPAAISIENLHKAVEREGLCYAPDPTEKSAFLGGTVATNASGAKTFRYGPTRDWIRRLRLVLPNGDVLDIKRGEVFSNIRDEFEIELTSGETVFLRTPSYEMPHVKNAAGYWAQRKMDLIDLFIGSEGTIGVFTEVEVRLIESLGHSFDCLAFFPTMSDALEFCNTARQIAKSKEAEIGLDLVDPLSLEYFNYSSLEFQRSRNQDIPADAKAAILFEQAVQAEKLYDCLAQWNKLFEQHHVSHSWLPMDQKDREKLTEFRHSLPENINNYVRSKGTHKIATDIAVPGEKFGEIMRFHEEIGLEMQIRRAIVDLGLTYDRKLFERSTLTEKVKFVEGQMETGPDLGQTSSSGASYARDYELLADRVDAIRRLSRTEVAYVIFGHIGDFHLHFNFLPRSPAELEEMNRAAVRLAKKAVELGGTITAEHGVGKKTYREDGFQKPYLEILYGKQGLESIAAIKNALDPNWVLNRGNVVPHTYAKEGQGKCEC